MKKGVFFLLLLASFIPLSMTFAQTEKPVVSIGSSETLESKILAEIAARIVENSGSALIQKNLGFDSIPLVHQAIQSGEVQLFPEGMDRLAKALSPRDGAVALEKKFEKDGLDITSPLGAGDQDLLFVARKDFIRDFPAAWEGLNRLEGTLSVELMNHLKNLVTSEGKTPSQAADIYMGSIEWLQLFEKRKLKVEAPPTPEEDRYQGESLASKMWRLAKEQLFIIGISFGASFLIGFPLGLFGAAFRPLGQLLRGLDAVFETIPSLAYLCLFAPFLGVGQFPALVALTLFSVMIIARGVQKGLSSLPQELIDIAHLIGLSWFQTFRKISFPMALPAFFQGLERAAVVNVGLSTLAAVVGAGGFGTRILIGLELKNPILIFEGVVAVMTLAFALKWAIKYVELSLVHPSLQAPE